MTEFLETGDHFDKEDCERNAAKRLLEKLHKRLPRERFLIGGMASVRMSAANAAVPRTGDGLVFTFKGTGKNRVLCGNSKAAMDSAKYRNL